MKMNERMNIERVFTEILHNPHTVWELELIANLYNRANYIRNDPKFYFFHTTVVKGLKRASKRLLSCVMLYEFLNF